MKGTVHPADKSITPTPSKLRGLVCARQMLGGIPINGRVLMGFLALRVYPRSLARLGNIDLAMTRVSTTTIHHSSG
jgi:hypothetical protein